MVPQHKSRGVFIQHIVLTLLLGVFVALSQFTMCKRGFGACILSSYFCGPGDLVLVFYVLKQALSFRTSL